MSSKDEERKKVVGLLRSVLMAEKRGVPLERVTKEYYGLVGKPIPWRALGYATLEEFLDQSPDLCRVSYSREGQILIHSVATGETKHIQEMVGAQRNKKKRVPQRRPNAMHRGGFNQSNNRSGGGGGGQMRRPPLMGHRPMGPGMQQGRGRGGGRGGGASNGARRMNGGAATPLMNPNAPAFNPASNAATQLNRNNSNSQNHRNSSNNNNNSYQRNNSNGGNNNNSPPKPAPVKIIPASELKAKQELSDLCKSRGIPEPEFKTSSMSTGGKGSSGAANKTYYSTCLVAGERLQTYPNDYPTAEMAEDAVSKKALAKLRGGSPAAAASPTPGAASETASGETLSKEVLGRIVAILGKRANGVWSTQIDVEYKRKHNGSQLPESWPQQLTPSCPLRMETPIPGASKFIIYPKVSYDESATAAAAATETKVPQTNGKSHASSSSSSTAAKPTSSSSAPPPSESSSSSKLPRISFPADDFWDVYITTVSSPVECYVRLIGEEYSDKFDDLVTEMEMHYFKAEDKPSVEKPVVGQLYVAKYEGEWHRVKVTTLAAGADQASCFFIDNGETDLVEVKCIQELHANFCTMPAQAFSVKLFGLESVVDGANVQSELQNALLGKSLIGERHWNNGTDANSPVPDISLTFFDSSTDEDVNLNEVLLAKLAPNSKGLQPAAGANGSSPRRTATPTSPAKPPQPAAAVPAAPAVVQVGSNGDSSSAATSLLPDDLASFKELMPPKVPGRESFFDVTVTSAASPSNFICQPWETAPELEEHQLAMSKFYSNASGSSSSHRAVTAADIESDKFFAVKHTDGAWYRARVKSYTDQTQLSVRFVDYGEYALVDMADMRPLASQFRNLPMQAVCAALADIVAVDGDWSMDDIHWFSSRVLQRQFVSVIKDRFFDDEESAMHIRVSLVDVTHATRDTYVEKELADKGRAAFLCL